VAAHVSLPNTATAFAIVLYILILTALLMGLDLNICLRQQRCLLPAAVLDFIS
jgi:hypothetical protein